MFAAKAQQDNAVLSISAIDNDLEQASLSAAFMKNAEVSQSWRTISLDLWIEAGRWWLLKVSFDRPALPFTTDHPENATNDTCFSHKWGYTTTQRLSKFFQSQHTQIC